MRVLVTRPEPDGEKTAQKLVALGFEPVVSRLSRIVPVDPGPLPLSDAVIATSGHALSSLPEPWRIPALLDQPIHVVGGRTAESAFEAGFGTILQGPGDANGLVESIIAGPARPDFLYLAGEPRKPVVETRLIEAGFRLRTVILYRNEPLPEAPPELLDLLSRPEALAVLHFSRASAESFARLANATATAPLLHVCLSHDVASVLAGDIIVAEHPNEASLLEALQLRRG